LELYPKFIVEIDLDLNYAGSAQPERILAVYNLVLPAKNMSGAVLEVPEREGYRFLGFCATDSGTDADELWYDGSMRPSDERWNISGCDRLYARWEVIAGPINFVYDDDATDIPDFGEVGAEYFEETPELPAEPTAVARKANHTFDGYWTTPSGAGVQYYDEILNVKTAVWTVGDLTLYARWLDVSDLEFSDIGNSKYSVKGKNAQAENIAVPKHYNGGLVTQVQSDGFSGYDKLKTVSLPDGVISIGNGAFRMCTALTMLALPISLETIGENAFYFSYNMSIVSWPASLREIGASAFYSCWGLKSISFTAGSSLQSIGNSAFASCSELTEAILANSSIISIGNSAFALCVKLGNITLPSTLTTIGNLAFDRCGKLASIVLPASLESMGSSVFKDCKILFGISIPNKVTQLSSGLFEGCDVLRNVTLHNSITGIGASVFAGCIALENIDLPASLKSIGSGAFANCVKLKSIVIPAGVVTVGQNVFSGCTGIAITVPFKVDEKPADWNDGWCGTEGANIIYQN
jgi:uncharacterized repeat protein (TIGR02543 family)